MERLPEFPTTTAAALASPLLSYFGWHLMVDCMKCPQGTKTAIDQIYNAQPWLRMVDLVARVRCQHCANRPTRVRLCDAEPFTGRAEVVEIELLATATRAR
jgi:hypothetical protein